MIEWFKHTPRTATPTSTARPARAWMMPLEPRIMFDAAAAATVAEASHGDDSQAAADASASDASVVPATDATAQGSTESPARQDIVFIDAGVRDIASLLGSIRPEVEVHVVQNGLTEIAQILANRQDVDSVQIISHGQANAITLSGQVLHAESLAAYASELQTIGAALAPQGDILLYGCNTGTADAQHADFVSALAAATGRDVAASTDNSGSAQLGGNWVLERHTGTIEAGLFTSGSAVSYGDLLAAPTSEAFDGVTLTNGHSYGTPGEARIINGWIFTMLGADGNLDTGINSYIDVTNVVNETTLANNGADHAALFNGTYAAGTGQAAAVLAATTGEEFAFQSIVVEQSASDGADYRLVGYRNGSAVSGATHDFTAGTYTSGGGTLVTVSGSAWQNLDAVYIVRQGGQTDVSIYVDDITVAAVVRPTATVVVADTALAAGETSLVTFTFSQAVTGFTNGDLSIANGTLSAVTSGNGGVTWTATFTPTAGITDTTNLITVNMAGVSSTGTSVAGTGTQSSNNFAIDTARPTATIVVADNVLGIGETSAVTITFSEAVTGFTNANLTVANGTLSAVSSSDGGVTWTATLTPTASIIDATNVITLANTGVTDAAGNAGTGTTDSNNYAIDGIRPTASIVVADTSLLAGETSLVTITFSEAVTGFTNADLTIANGTLSAVSSSDGGITWTATLTPTANITDAANVITLANAGVTDTAGNAGTGATDSNNYAVNTVRPTASIVVADAALAIGETSLVTITFSEAVTGFTNADLTIANGTLSAVSSSDGGVTWTATLTPTASITDATNVITLTNAGVTNAVGNTGNGTTNSNNYAIDSTRPTANIVVADTVLGIGETSAVTITFSEAVTGFTNADLTIANGTLSAVSSSDGGVTWTATFTPTVGITDATNVITLDNTDITDVASNAGTGATDSNNYAIDSTQPTANIVVADTVLAIGQTSLVTITFSEAVTGFTNADLTVANGTLSAVSSGDGGITWTATFTPTAGITDATNVITLANTGVTNAVGNAGSGTTDSNNYAIDTVRPTATIVVADSALAAGETSLVTITFSEAVTGFTNADLTVVNGTLSAVSSGDGGITWTATFTPTAGITDATNVITLANTGVTDTVGNAGTGTTASSNYAIDSTRPMASIIVADTALAAGETSLVTITFSEAVTDFTSADLTVANGTLSAVSSSDGGITWTATLTPTTSITDATNVITLDTINVTDAAGNAGNGTTVSNNYAIDTARPTASIVVADTALAAGETSLVTITFSEAVTGFTNVDLTVANGTLSTVSSGDGGITWTATFTPTASITDATNVITLANTGVTDAAGNAGAGTTDSNNYAIDSTRPTTTIVVADTALATGETSLVTITFSEAVADFTNADLTVANGTLSAVSSSDGGITWTATLTPTASITDATNVITLANTGVTDAAGNAGTSTTDSNNYAIDSTRPSITGIVLPADATYLAGQNLDFTLNFSETVTVDTTGGVPRIELTLDTGGTQYAEYVSGSGGTSLVFRFTTARDQLDSNGIGVSGVLDLNGASVRDAAGNDTALALNGLGATTGLRIDAVAPFVSSVSGPADGRHNAGDVLSFTITTSESLTIDTTGGVPRLALIIGQSTVYASYVSGSGSSTLLFEYAVQAGDNDANGIAIGALQANGATLRDVTGNALDPSLSGVTNSPGVLVDTSGPQVTAIARTDTSLSSGSTVFYTVSFSEAVSGLGAEDFGLVSTGSARGTIGAVSQLDATTYRVAIDGIAGSGSLRLDLAASGSGITDLAGNPLAAGLQGPIYRLDPVHLVLTPEPPPAPTVLPSQPAQEPGSLPSVTFDPMAPIMQLDTPTLTVGMPGASSTPWATRGAYIDLGSDIGGRGLQSMPDLGSFHLQPIAPLSISLPGAIFTHSDRGAQVSVDLRLADGRPLPAWLKFDALTGTLTGQPPAGTSGRLQIEVIARDNNGNRATSQLIIEFERAVETQPVPNILPRALLDRSNAPHTTELVDRAPTTPAGRTALAAQFERYGQAARNAERAALLQHLRSASSTPRA